MTTKSSVGILRMAQDGETLAIIGTAYGRGPVQFTATQRTAPRPTASGRPADRPLQLFEVVLRTTLVDNANTAELLSWFGGNGRTYQVDWRPNGDGSGQPQVTFNAVLRVGGAFSTDRIRDVTLTATGSFTQGTQS